MRPEECSKNVQDVRTDFLFEASISSFIVNGLYLMNQHASRREYSDNLDTIEFPVCRVSSPGVVPSTPWHKAWENRLYYPEYMLANDCRTATRLLPQHHYSSKIPSTPLLLQHNFDNYWCYNYWCYKWHFNTTTTSTQILHQYDYNFNTAILKL